MPIPLDLAWTKKAQKDISIRLCSRNSNTQHAQMHDKHIVSVNTMKPDVSISLKGIKKSLKRSSMHTKDTSYYKMNKKLFFLSPMSAFIPGHLCAGNPAHVPLPKIYVCSLHSLRKLHIVRDI